MTISVAPLAPLGEGHEQSRSPDRLYQDIARKLTDVLASGAYAIGERLPAERELANEFAVSRQTIREAIIALEVRGLVEVRMGSGAHVRALPGDTPQPGFDITAFELTEARILFEGEAAALAASLISDEELATLARLLDDIAAEHARDSSTDSADRAFHLAIARATRNSAIFETVERLWTLRSLSAESAALYALARRAKIQPPQEEHRAIFDALSARDPIAARLAMRHHLQASLDALLFTTEEQAVAQLRSAASARRTRYHQTRDI